LGKAGVPLVGNHALGGPTDDRFSGERIAQSTGMGPSVRAVIFLAE